MKIKTDKRGVEYVEDADLSSLPSGWFQCGTCGRAWNDEKSTSVTPTPSGRCPFEYEHAYDDPPESDPALVEVLAEARAIVARIDGGADLRVTARQARALARKLDKLA